VVITAAISPYRQTREEVRRRHEAPFVEVFVDCDIDTLLQRDTKGLYAQALRGEITNFSGISDPYEPPVSPEIVVHTAKETVAQSVDHILAELEKRRLIPHAHAFTGR
jgi:adenylylsulfate kinase